MRTPLVAGNWKMNGSLAENESLLTALLDGLDRVGKAEIAVCVPYVYIPQVAQILKGSRVAWGAQDVAKEEQGAFTGEVSASMLRDFQCTYAIVGHSERRSLYGESDELVALKFAAAIEKGLVPILCVGELLEERERGTTEAVVERQLKAVVEHCGIDSFAAAVIAYEPVWAIGTGKTATPRQAQDVHAFIRGWLAEQSETVASEIRILYGGSVKAANAAELFVQDDIDGGLIGGASLNAEEFLKICEAAG